MKHWSETSIFYHIYPLGLCNAPELNNPASGCVNRIHEIYQWLDPIQELGANAIYLGPIFQSRQHGYDTSDYYQIDRRLGSNADFQRLSEEIHRRGMRLVLDGVFNHVGRDFWAFRDLQKWGKQSAYRDWFVGVDFERRSPW